MALRHRLSYPKRPLLKTFRENNVKKKHFLPSSVSFLSLWKMSTLLVHISVVVCTFSNDKSTTLIAYRLIHEALKHCSTKLYCFTTLTIKKNVESTFWKRKKCGLPSFCSLPTRFSTV